VPASLTRPPAGFRINASHALDAASRTGAVDRATRGAPTQVTPRYDEDPRQWVIAYAQHGRGVAEAQVDGVSGRVLHVWTGVAANFDLARGRDSLFGDTSATSPLVWLAFSIAFLVPFVDPRRLRRRLHLDLGLLTCFSIPVYLWWRRDLETSQLIASALLVLLAARFAQGGLGRGGDAEPVPYLRTRALAVGVVVLAAAHVVLNLTAHSVSDIGFGSLAGGDRFVHGLDVYSRGGATYDTYGPVVYLVYAPFALLWPLKSLFEANPAGAHAAALVVDLATAGLLIGATSALSRENGLRLGLAAGWAWLASPFVVWTVAVNTNDGLVALTTAAAAFLLVRGRSPARAGAAMGVAAMTKFAPLALVPLFAGFIRGRRARMLFLGATAAAALAVLIPLLPDGGPREVWDTTIGYQSGRASPFGPWSYLGGSPAQGAAMALVALFVLGLALARPRSGARLFALAAAALVATELPLGYWFFFYLVWPLPLIVMAWLADDARSAVSSSAMYAAKGSAQAR
jgi:hypothetical protein